MTQHMQESQGRVVLTPRRGALLAGQDNTLDVLVRVQAPLTMPEERSGPPPLNLAIVLDRSGSMSGRPLHEAKRCAQFMVSRLRGRDRVALVQFDHEAEVLAGVTPMSRAADLDAWIAAIQSRGNTNLHGGWLAGAEQLAPLAEEISLQRVILLSDGCANRGLTDTDEITRQCAQLAEVGVTTSTYGLGRHFNEALMVAMARAGQGNHYFGQTAEDLLEPFSQEFDLLDSLWLRKVRLHVRPAPGVRVKLLNAYTRLDDGDAWRLPDIAIGAEAWAVLRLTVPAALVDAAVPTLLAVEVRGTRIDGGAIDYAQSLPTLPALPAAAFAVVSEDELVARRGTELEAAALLEQCRAAAENHDWPRVDALVADARIRFAANAWVSGILEDMQAFVARRDRAMMMKEALYSSSNLSSRIPSSLELAYADTDGELDTRSFLRRKTSQGRAEFIKPQEPGEAAK